MVHLGTIVTKCDLINTWRDCSHAGSGGSAVVGI